MNTKLYIGSELADFNEVFNVMFSIGDIRDMSEGNNNKTYTLNLPLTKTNKRLLKFISQPDVKSEPNAIERLYIGEQLIIQGSIIILGYSDYYAKVIINQDDWVDSLKDKKMTELDLSASDHVLNHANVEDSWTAAYPFYRYPMINFGALASGEIGLTAKWSPNDFIPMFSISQLITKILAPYTINSAWLGTAFIKDLYIIGKEALASDGFIVNKEFEVAVQTASDNQFSDTINTGITKDFEITIAAFDFNTVTKDEGSDWNVPNNIYVVPETGTYFFAFDCHPAWTTYAGITINSQELQGAIMCLRGASHITLAAEAYNYVSTDILSGITYTLETGYVHLIAGDQIYCPVSMIQNLTNSGVSQTITMNFQIDITKFYVTWNSVNRYSGLNKNISAEEMLPDMTQVDFLKAIKEIFNLRFWMDKSKQNLYIEPWDQFLSSTVINLTEFIDFSVEPDTELISLNYNKTTTLKWKDDTSDMAYTEYLKSAVGPGQKDIALTSLFTKPGTDTKEHPFSSLIMGFNQTTYEITPVPRIWNAIPEYPYIIFDRKTGFNTRIVHWDGLTAGFTWYYETETKTTYPKIAGLDFATIYSDYWQKLFHYIDKGKLLTVRMRIKSMFLTQFFTVIANSSAEGFRPTYQINDDYYFLQKITTDGQSCELELILKV